MTSSTSTHFSHYFEDIRRRPACWMSIWNSITVVHSWRLQKTVFNFHQLSVNRSSNKHQQHVVAGCSKSHNNHLSLILLSYFVTLCQLINFNFNSIRFPYVGSRKTEEKNVICKINNELVAGNWTGEMKIEHEIHRRFSSCCHSAVVCHLSSLFGTFNLGVFSLRCVVLLLRFARLRQRHATNMNHQKKHMKSL